MAYFDFFLAPVSNDKRADYEAFLEPMHEYFLSLGATEVLDAWGDDVPPGQLTSFPLAVKLEDGETVAAGFVGWPSKADRDAGWEKMMQSDPIDMPFDGKRMIFGGFTEMLRTGG